MLNTLINNNRQQNGRRRGRGGQNRPGGGGGGRGPESGNRIDNRARGNAPQLLEKYKGLARDAQQSGDRVAMEYYLQFADHYFRVVNESRARFEEQRQARESGDGQGYDVEEEPVEETDEFGYPIVQQQQAPPPRRDQPRDYGRDRDRDGRQDNRGERDGRQDNRGERQDNRPAQRQDNRPDGRNDGRQDGRQEARNDNRPDTRPERSEQRPDNRERWNTYNRDRDGNADGNREESGTETAVTPEPVRAVEDDRPRRRELPPRRERPQREEQSGSDQGSSLGFDASVLPPAIGAQPEDLPLGLEGEPVVAPKRRGRPRKDAAAAAE